MRSRLLAGALCAVSLLASAAAADRQPPVQQKPSNQRWSRSESPNAPAAEESRDCRRMNRLRMEPPRIDIGREIPSRNPMSKAVEIFGSVEGVCLIEAGYFEYGRKVQNIPISTQADFRRFDFRLSVRSDANPEIRVYSINGGRDSISLSPRN